MIEDWELGVLYLKEVDRLGEEQSAAESVKNKFFDVLCAPDKDTQFFMGTVFPYNTWIVLGVFWPPKNSSQSASQRPTDETLLTNRSLYKMSMKWFYYENANLNVKTALVAVMGSSDKNYKRGRRFMCRLNQDLLSLLCPIYCGMLDTAYSIRIYFLHFEVLDGIIQHSFYKEVKVIMPRKTFKYHLKQGNKTIRSGITNDLDRREQEHQQDYGQNVHIFKVGNASTREGAAKWEKEQKQGTP